MKPSLAPVVAAALAVALAVTAILAAAHPLLAAPESAPPTVAVAYFDDNSGDAAYAPLRKGLADMLITDLSGIGSIRIVERERLNAVLDELKLGESKFIDATTAQKLGKGLSAAYVLTGAYTVSGDTMRLDARVVTIETGAIAAAEKVEGPKEAFFALEKELVDVLVKTLDLKLGFAEKTKLRSNPTESFDAWLAYSAGLDATDRGDSAEAQKRFRAALAADPGYAQAKSALGRLEAIFARDDRQRAARIQELTKQLDATSPDFPAKVDALLQTFDNADTDQLGQKVALLTWLVEHDLTPSMGPFSRTSMEILGLVSRFLSDPDSFPKIPAVCEYCITRYPNDLSAKPQCKAYVQALKRMTTLDQDSLRASFRRGREEASLDWDVAITKNEEAIQRLFDACVRKVEAR